VPLLPFAWFPFSLQTGHARARIIKMPGFRGARSCCPYRRLADWHAAVARPCPHGCPGGIGADGGDQPHRRPDGGHRGRDQCQGAPIRHIADPGRTKNTGQDNHAQNPPGMSNLRSRIWPGPARPAPSPLPSNRHDSGRSPSTGWPPAVVSAAPTSRGSTAASSPDRCGAGFKTRTVCDGLAILIGLFRVIFARRRTRGRGWQVSAGRKTQPRLATGKAAGKVDTAPRVSPPGLPCGLAQLLSRLASVQY